MQHFHALFGLKKKQNWREQITESFHAKSSDLFTSQHPNIAVFIKNVLAMQTNSYLRMNSANSNESRTIIRIQHII